MLCMHSWDIRSSKGSSFTKGTNPHQLNTPLKNKKKKEITITALSRRVNCHLKKSTHFKRLFLKNILFFAKEALGASVRSMACVQSSCRRQNHRTSPWVNWGPHPCLPRRNVWGSYSAAVTEHGLKQWAQCLSWKCWIGMLLYSMWLRLCCLAVP